VDVTRGVSSEFLLGDVPSLCGILLQLRCWSGTRESCVPCLRTRYLHRDVAGVVSEPFQLRPGVGAVYGASIAESGDLGCDRDRRSQYVRRS